MRIRYCDLDWKLEVGSLAFVVKPQKNIMISSILLLLLLFVLYSAKDRSNHTILINTTFNISQIVYFNMYVPNGFVSGILRQRSLEYQNLKNYEMIL